MNRNKGIIGIAMTFGIMVGSVIGAVTENVGFWITFGLMAGLLIGAAIYTLLPTSESE